MPDLTQHSPLGGSGASRWMLCPGSVRLSYGVEDPESEYSTRGKAAHALAEQCLTSGRDAWEYVNGVVVDDGRVLKVVQIDKLYPHDWVFIDPPMADGVQVYLNAVRSAHPIPPSSTVFAYVEYEFHCPTIHEYFWGQADYVYHDAAERVLHVWDFKNGFMDVEVIENPQLMYYGTGVLEKMQMWDMVDNVVLHICQPNGFNSDGPVREWTISTEKLWEWSENVLVPAMDRALASRDTASGEHCRFCPARSRACPQILSDMYELESMFMFLAKTNDPEKMMEAMKLNADEAARELTDKEAGRFKDLLDVAKIAGKAVDDTVFGRMMAGHDIPNRKLVKARSNRTWKDDAEDALKKKYAAGALTDRKLKSPSEIEKMLGGKQMTARHAFKPDKGLTVARSDDKRQAVDRDPAKGFEDVTK